MAALLLACAAVARRSLLPSDWEVVEGLKIHDGRRRRLSGASLHEADALAVAFHTATAAFEVDLRRVSLWRVGSKLLVHEAGTSTDYQELPTLPAFQGHLRNGSGTGGVSATILPGDLLRMHIYEDGHDIAFESAMHFDTSATPTLTSASNIVFRTPALKGADHEDEVLHHSSRPLMGLHLPEDPAQPAGRRRTERSAARRLSALGTLPTGPPYGRLSGCVSSPAYYTNKIGLVVDHGFASVAGGTLTAVLAELASLITQTNVIYSDQVGVEFALGTVVVMAV